MVSLTELIINFLIKELIITNQDMARDYTKISFVQLQIKKRLYYISQMSHSCISNGIPPKSQHPQSRQSIIPTPKS